MESPQEKIERLRRELDEHNYNYYVSYYRDTFQHGGISMEEMLIPLITLQSKKRN